MEEEHDLCGICFEKDNLTKMNCCNNTVHAECIGKSGIEYIKRNVDFTCPFCRCFIERRPLEVVPKYPTTICDMMMSELLLVSLKHRIDVEDLAFIFMGNAELLYEELNINRDTTLTKIRRYGEFNGSIVILVTIAIKMGYFKENSTWGEELDLDFLHSMSEKTNCSVVELAYVFKITHSILEVYGVLIEYSRIKQIRRHRIILEIVADSGNHIRDLCVQDLLYLDIFKCFPAEKYGKVIYSTQCTRREAFEALLHTELDVVKAIQLLMRNGKHLFRPEGIQFTKINMMSLYATFDKKDTSIHKEINADLRVHFIDRVTLAEENYFLSFCNNKHEIDRFLYKFYRPVVHIPMPEIIEIIVNGGIFPIPNDE